MASQSIHGNRAVFSEQSVVASISKALGEIKHQDALTWEDMAAVFGKCPDQVAKYYEGSAKMDVVTFHRGEREWGSRFTGYIKRLCEDSKPGKVNDRHGHTSLLEAALAFSVALEDGNISAAEVRANRHVLEEARDAIDAQLRKLGPIGDAA